MCNIGEPRASGLGLAAGKGCCPGTCSIGDLVFVVSDGYGMLPQRADNCPSHPNNELDGVTPPDNYREPNPDQTDRAHNGIGILCDPAEQAAWLHAVNKVAHMLQIHSPQCRPGARSRTGVRVAGQDGQTTISG